jgi:hypothetical protein
MQVAEKLFNEELKKKHLITPDIILSFEEEYTEIWCQVYYALCLTISGRKNL